eukprot:CAMPEP_0194356690 /NCGR_PEP_ID=MMETSP0174-20130528/4283_1 /TAXON_ID=216777 /ORGANISM="Proboscia alata, Strain PI-D3" /LENGTH=524 /DNA_ID=CAMNT_0039126385 /DNA_START=18 /DNA_END=1592 /DNA_ORIENTATION=-
MASPNLIESNPSNAVFNPPFWNKLLNEPSTPQNIKDIAHSSLEDEIGTGERMHLTISDSGVLVNSYEDDPDGSYGEGLHKGAGWIRVEAWERDTDKKNHLEPNEAVSLAGEAYMIAEQQDNEHLPVKFNTKVNTAAGHPGVKVSYPKLHQAAIDIVTANSHGRKKGRHNNIDRGDQTFVLANAYIVLALLESKEQDYAKGLEFMSKAADLRPKDWRIRFCIANFNLAFDQKALMYRNLVIAEKLASESPHDDAAFFVWHISMLKAKTLHHLGQKVRAKGPLEKVMIEYAKFEHHPRLNARCLGRLAVGQFMLSYTYAVELTSPKKHSGRRQLKETNRSYQLTKARRHFKQAEHKRNSLPLTVAKNIDWGTRTLAQMVLAHLATPSSGYVTNHEEEEKIQKTIITHNECHHCGDVTTNIQKCAGCKKAAYCSKACQKLAWKSGHKEECKKIQQQHQLIIAKNKLSPPQPIKHYDDLPQAITTAANGNQIAITEFNDLLDTLGPDQKEVLAKLIKMTEEKDRVSYL